MSEAIQLQAPVGGELHKLSDKFYKGGQFMPEPDALAGCRKEARKAAQKMGVFTDPQIGQRLGLKIPVSVLRDGRRKAIAWVDSTDAAMAIRDELRKAIEIRLGGKALNWDE